MIIIDKNAISRTASIDVKFFYNNAKSRFKLTLHSDETGFSREIKDQNVHRPGLALAGFVELFSYERVQIFGNTEITYLKNLSVEKRLKSLHKIFEFNIPCIILTDGNQPFPEMVDLAIKQHVPLFSSPLLTTKLTYLISDFLDDQFAPRASIHGSFVDVYGVGILFIGKSGVGKSEVALDLIERGHRLVGDDVIILTKKGEGILIGAGTSLVKHFMEIRGLGILDIQKMFGVRAIRQQKRLEVICELEVWSDGSTYTRTGLDETLEKILDVEIPYVKLPIIPGKNITVISEVIALHYLLKHNGYDAAEVFKNRLERAILNKSKENSERGVNYFEHDFE
ncbi:MAG: HPr(Ser) kinase/phosphatase [Ignavibacteria bacterium]|nr:HPr(Ser) kinase/phosphatase [Ignavibacteria bacterium]